MNTTTCIYYTDNHFEQAFNFMINLVNERLTTDKKLKFEELQLEECIRNKNNARIRFNNGDQIRVCSASFPMHGIRWHYAYIDSKIPSSVIATVLVPCAISAYYDNIEQSFIELKEPVKDRIFKWEADKIEI